MVDFRPARPDEIETIRALERASAQRFVGLIDALAADEPSPATVLAIRIADGGLIVAVEDGTIVGFAMFRRGEGSGRRCWTRSRRKRGRRDWTGCRCRPSATCRGTRRTTGGWGSWRWRTGR